MPLSKLDEIPWHRLTHAYGTAEDVPDLIRALQSELPEVTGDDSAVYQLFGNIWHQGTIYEATSYAVPFLLELAADPKVPNRRGVVGLLAAIAMGTSYLEVHEDALAKLGMADKNSAKHQKRKAQELTWVVNTQQEVVKGIDLFVGLSRTETDIRLDAAEVLSAIKHSEVAKHRLLEMLGTESEPNATASLILLLSRTNIDAANGTIFSEKLLAPEAIVRRAATMACLRISYGLNSILVREQMVEAVLDADFLSRIEKLPLQFDSLGHLPKQCLEELDKNERNEIFEILSSQLDQMAIDSDQTELLLSLVFPNNEDANDANRITLSNVTEDQRRVIKGLIVAVKENKVRIDSPWRWGLPEYRRDWKNLVDGLPPIKVNESLPMLGQEAAPSSTVQLHTLEIGDRVHHRAYGFGSIKSLERDKTGTSFAIDFDDEGWHSFHFEQQRWLNPETFLTRLIRSIMRPFERT